MRIKRFIHLLAVIVTTMCMSGCTPKQIIEDPDAKYRLTALEDSQLEKNTYYVKDKTKFYATYMPNGNAQGKATKLDAKRLLWTQKDNELIPTYYKGELIAYYSEEPSLTNIGLERFKDIGFSVGLKGAKYENGYVTFAASSNCIKGSSMATALSNLPSDNIRIVTINGNPVSEDTVNAAGVIASLAENETYEFAIYSGSKYMTITATADLHFYQAYELYSIDKAKDTLNGYLAITVPEDLKSGFYLINGKGLFKYYDSERGVADVSQDMNTPYYTSEADQISAYSQQYVVSVPTAVNEVEFVVKYDNVKTSDDNIKAYLTAPDGTAYEMFPLAGTMSVSLETAMKGRWTINIAPKDLEILSIDVVEVETYEHATSESFQFDIEAATNLKIFATYEGSGEIWGTITDSSGNVCSMDLDKQNHTLYYTYPYIAEDTYTVTIYHYADTIVTKADFTYDEDNLSEEIITIVQ